MKWLFLVAIAACGAPREAPRPSPPPSSPAAPLAATTLPAAPRASSPPAPLVPRPAARTPTALTEEQWTFTESALSPVFERIESVGRPQEVFATSDATHLIVVDNLRDFEVRSPSKVTSNPRPQLAWPYVRVSPRGDYAALVEEQTGRDWEMGSNLSVLRFSDHAIVATFDGGADPHWAGDVLTFRVGNQAKRLDLPATDATDVGPPQTTHGCPNAALRGYTRVDESMCPSGRYSRVIAVDSAVTTWLVVDDNGTHETALRLVDLASGRDRVLADRSSHGFPLYVRGSPGGTRYCLTPKTPSGYQLHCGRFPAADDQVKLLDLGPDKLPNLDWLDEDRLLVSGVGIIDLASGRKIELSAGLGAATRLVGTLGPRYVVADMGWVFLLDLEIRRWTRIDRDGYRVFPEATAAGRIWVTQTDKDLRTRLFEMRLAPK